MNWKPNSGKAPQQETKNQRKGPVWKKYSKYILEKKKYIFQYNDIHRHWINIFVPSNLSDQGLLYWNDNKNILRMIQSWFTMAVITPTTVNSWCLNHIHLWFTILYS